MEIIENPLKIVGAPGSLWLLPSELSMPVTCLAPAASGDLMDSSVCQLSFSWRLQRMMAPRTGWCFAEALLLLGPNGYGIVCYDPHHGALGEAVCRLYLNTPPQPLIRAD